MISQRRREWSRKLVEQLVVELRELSMPTARFEIELEPRSRDDSPLEVDGRRVDFGPTGHDQVTYFFSPTPGDDFRSAVSDGTDLYLITHEFTTTVSTEIWRVPLAAPSVPATATLVGSIPHHYCTGLALDTRYFYTACQTGDEVVRVDRTTFATEVMSGLIDLSSTRNAVHAHDLDTDGVADVLYVNSATEAAPSFAGLSLDKPRLFGVINVTPDSFSDGGEALALSEALKRGRAMLDDGADILDVGGESTRPGAEPVSAEEERARVVPVVKGLSEMGALVSIDTRRAEVMAAAIDAGAGIVNDVTALTGDQDSLGLVADRGVAVVLMPSTSVPAPGSVMPMPATHSPLMVLGR